MACTCAVGSLVLLALSAVEAAQCEIWQSTASVCYAIMPWVVVGEEFYLLLDSHSCIFLANTSLHLLSCCGFDTIACDLAALCHF